MRNICKIEKCKSFVKGKGLCAKHYRRLQRYGDANFVQYRAGESRVQNPLYNTHARLLGRCFNKNNPKYPGYGGRGITVCDRWLGVDGFSNFIKDMGECPENHSIDRIDNDGNYSPENCKWSDPHQQSANRRCSNEIIGVFYDAKNNRWEACLSIGKKRYRQMCKTKILAEVTRAMYEAAYLSS